MNAALLLRAEDRAKGIAHIRLEITRRQWQGQQKF